MPENSRRLEREKNRANQAFRDVNELKDSSVAKKYKSLLKKTPARIKNSGLEETIAFIFSKRKTDNHFDRLYFQLRNWLQTTGYPLSSEEEFVAQIIQLDRSLYRCAANETLAYLTWVKRFTEGLIQGEEDDSNED